MATVTRHRAQKRFGQNFLQDDQVINDFLLAFNPQFNDNVLEIGPGLGALTQALLPCLARLHAIEIDQDLAPVLRQQCQSLGQLDLHVADILTFDLTKFVKPNQPLRVVGNLPYNISTPLLFRLMEHSAMLQDIQVMLQYEVGQRLLAQPGTKAYGRLSVMLQYHCQIQGLFDVPPTAFKPEPQVNSMVLRLVPYKTKPVVAKDWVIFAEIVQRAFSQRRKTLRNSLSGFVDADILVAVDVDPGARPEQLTVANFVAISNNLCNY